MDQVPRPLLEGIVRVFDPVRVILFGSRARGDHHEDSDFDLYVVVDDDAPDETLSGRTVAKARGAFRGSVDILVRRRSVAEERGRWLNVVDRDVADEGVVVYARG